MDLRPQAHDIIRTWLFDRCCASHLEHGSLPWTNAAISGWVLDPGPQEDVEVQGQRRHADGAARGARIGRRALLGGERPARHRHGVRRGPDEGRPPAGDQAAERVEVRAGAGRAARGGHRDRRPRHAHEPVARWCGSRRDDLEAYDYTRVLERTETFFWSSATTISSSSRRGGMAIRAEAARRIREPAPADGALGRCCGCSRRSCRS